MMSRLFHGFTILAGLCAMALVVGCGGSSGAKVTCDGGTCGDATPGASSDVALPDTQAANPDALVGPGVDATLADVTPGEAAAPVDTNSSQDATSPGDAQFDSPIPNPPLLDAAADAPLGGADGQSQATGGTGGGGVDGSGGTDAEPAGLIPGYTAPWSGSGDPAAGTTAELVTVTSASSTDTPLYTLTGTSTAGVTTIHMEHDGASVDVVPQGGAFSSQVTLDPGVNDIYLVVDNGDGPLPPLHVVVVLVTGNPSSVDLIEAALAAGSITAEQALEYEVFAAFGDPRLPAALTGDDSLLLPEPIMAAVEQAAPTLSDDAQDVIGPFLAPDFYQGSAYEQRTQSNQHAHGLSYICNPLRALSDCLVSSNWTYFDGTRVRVWYEKGRSAQTVAGNSFDGNSDLAAATAVVLAIESPGSGAWDTLSALMGATPMSDANQSYNGGDGKLDVLLVDMVGDGLTTPNNGNGDVNKQTPVFIRLNRNKSVNNILGAAVHEFMHAIQYALPLSGGSPTAYLTLMEATATWATNRVLPTNDWEHQYDWAYFQATDRKLVSVTDPLKDRFPYGAWVFFLYLSQRLGDAAIANLWQGAAGNTDQLAILANTIAALGPDNDSKDPAKLWQDFGVNLWNGAPTNYFKNLDRIPDQPTTNGGDQPVALGTSGIGSGTFDVGIPTFSTRYFSLLFNDANVRTLLFLNGMNFNLTTAAQIIPVAGTSPVTCPAALPPPNANKAKTAYLSVVPKRDGTWSAPENWTTKFANGYSLSCRDDTSGVLNQLVLVASYADATDQSPFACPGNQPTLSYSSSFCARATGFASLSQPRNGINWTLDTTNFAWTKAADLASALPTGGYAICGNALDLSAGQIAMTRIGAESNGCTANVNQTEPAPTGANESRLSLFDFATSPATRFYSFQGFGINIYRGGQPILYTGTCQCTGQAATICDCTSDSFLFNTPMTQSAINYLIPNSGTLTGSGASMAVAGTGAWSVSPTP